jgi:hypothetical protein
MMLQGGKMSTIIMKWRLTIGCSGPGECGEMVTSDHVPGRFAQSRYDAILEINIMAIAC